MAKIFPCKLTGLHHLGCFFLINNYVTRIIYWNRIFQIEYNEMDQYGLNGSKCSKIQNKIKQRDDGKFRWFGCDIVRDGSEAGQDRRMRYLSPPSMVLFCPIPTLPYMTGKIFLPHSRPLGPREALPPPHKTLLFVNFPYNQYNFFNETYFINKNILEITTKFITSNQINFQKKLNNISKHLTRQSQNNNNINNNKIKISL